ncbi:MAG: NADH-quinone oxidoreductase subunit D, partial [Anaerolineae bacterium]|nr:NADH-quinone oxidoreductase subunit D [Anaerolineae bacterium]
YDVRHAFPYSGYDTFEVKTTIAQEGDAWARCRVRIRDMNASLDIIRQAAERLTVGQIDCFAPKPPPKQVPPGTAYASVEGARGEIGMYLISDGSERLVHAHIRAPSLANLSLLPLVAHRARVEHIETILNSLDISIAEVER